MSFLAVKLSFHTKTIMDTNDPDFLNTFIESTPKFVISIAFTSMIAIETIG